MFSAMFDNDFFDFRPSVLSAEEDAVIGQTYTSGPESGQGFNIDLTFVGGWTQELKQAAADAAEIISDVVIGGLSDVRFSNGQVIDDLAITMNLEEIDGPSGVLAFAGPSAIRGLGGLPFSGQATFDTADTIPLADAGEFVTVALHEMLHVLGFGTLWEIAGFDFLEETPGGLRFTGPEAIAAYQSTFPEIAAADPFSDIGVPVEEGLGAGSDRGHWDEEVFGSAEIMTPQINRGESNALTDLTIASLADLGYQVDPEFMVA